MAQPSFDEDRMKDLMKSAIIEVFEENRSVISELIREVLKDLALIEAIKEGQGSESVSREEIFSLLDRKS